HNTATDTGVVQSRADVSVTKSAPVTATAGTTISYSVTVTNNGPSNAAGVTMTDVVTPAVVTLTAPPGCSLGSPQQVTCFIGSMSPSTSVPFTITGTIAPNASGTITTTASAFGTTFDHATSNNLRSVATQIPGAAGAPVRNS